MNHLQKLIIILLIIFPITGDPQCDSKLEDECCSSIGQFKFLKSFSIDLKKNKSSRVSVALNSGIRYKISYCNAANCSCNAIIKVITTVHGNEQILGMTYNPNTKKHYTSIEFNCQKTGVYFLDFSFEDGNKGCSACILSVESW